MTKLFLCLLGAEKHDAALLMPCGSYQFLYHPGCNTHVLDGGELTPKRFHDAAADMARRWPSASRFRFAPRIVMDDADLAPAPQGQSVEWQQERDDLVAQIAEKDALIAAMQKTRRRLVKPEPALEPAEPANPEPAK